MNGDVKCIVSADAGCFTDPASKVERVSYPIITPRAAQVILSLVHGKPEFNWKVTRIDILNDVQYYIEQRKEKKSFYSNATTLRKTRYLLNPKFRIYGTVVPTEKGIKECDVSNPEEHLRIKHSQQFFTSLNRGKYHKHPSMGLSFLRADILEDDDSNPIDFNSEFKMFYEWSSNRTPNFFKASIVNGSLHVPDYLFTNKVFNYNK